MGCDTSTQIKQNSGQNPENTVANISKQGNLQAQIKGQAKREVSNMQNAPKMANETKKTVQQTKKVVEQAGSSQFTQNCLKELQQHNKMREKHNAPPLVLSKWLCDRAQRWADELTKKGEFEHSDCVENGKRMGENIFWYSATAKPGMASKSWYSEIKDYKYEDGEKSWDKCGHFTQIVWVGSKEVGFGFSKGNVVGNYYPAGNMMGSFSKNVLKP